VNRRDLTRSVIALPAGLAALIALPASAKTDKLSSFAHDPDADLLSLCRRYMSMERRQNILFDKECEAEEAGNRDLARWLSDVQRSYVPYQAGLRDEIVDIKPETQAGFQAKARVFITWVPRNLDGRPCGDFGPLWSLCRDLLGYDPGEGTA
jgi:hypothetical protein